jgi:phage major head subunit gpT-like protein
VEIGSGTTGERAFMTEEYLYGVRARYNFVPGPWWRIVAGDAT